MAERGDVLRVKRRLGFVPGGDTKSVVVVQANPLSAVLPTLLVVPLDPAVGAYANDPTALRISGDEAGSRVDQVAVPWQLGAISADAFSPGPVGRLRPVTLQRLDELLKLVLDLP